MRSTPSLTPAVAPSIPRWCEARPRSAAGAAREPDAATALRVHAPRGARQRVRARLGGNEGTATAFDDRHAVVDRGRAARGDRNVEPVIGREVERRKRGSEL